MAMSQHYKDAVGAWLADRGAPPCPFCREVRWEVREMAVLLSATGVAAGALPGGVGQGLPAAPLVCGSCGYVALIAAWRLGLVPHPDPDRGTKP